MTRVTLDIDINRVEGDLELQVDLEDGVIRDARCIGTLYRGFEQIMIGRTPTDSLVITPRVCGICGTAHLYAAVTALESLGGITPPEHAVLLRNLCLMAETVQSDLRQSFLFFTPDLCHTRYRDHALAGRIDTAFRPLQGDVVRGCLKATRDVLGIVALFGGQWPHSSWMLPGGVTLPANERRLLDAATILSRTVQWMEQAVLGGPLADWLALGDADALWQWLGASDARRHSALGLMTTLCRDAGMHTLGRGTEHMISYGLPPVADAGPAWPAGFYDGTTGQVEALDQLQINEHVRHSWFVDYGGGRHPWQGETIPDHQPNPTRYTWAKAPRYGDRVVQTGPLAELRIAGDPLIVDLLQREGDNTWLRQFARLRRATRGLSAMQQWIRALGQHLNQPHFISPGIDRWPDGESVGLLEAARGALGHWIKIKDGVIAKYQIVTPTAWNASPRDSADTPGHWEQSLVGLRLANVDDPVEIGHIVRSHDPCLVCTVHFIGDARKATFHV